MQHFKKLPRLCSGKFLPTCTSSCISAPTLINILISIRNIFYSFNKTSKHPIPYHKMNKKIPRDDCLMVWHRYNMVQYFSEIQLTFLWRFNPNSEKANLSIWGEREWACYATFSELQSIKYFITLNHLEANKKKKEILLSFTQTDLHVIHLWKVSRKLNGIESSCSSLFNSVYFLQKCYTN